MKVKYIEQCVLNGDTLDIPDYAIDFKTEYLIDKKAVFVSWFETVSE